MTTSAVVLKTLRKLHLYVGLFIAPTIVFFAFTGAMQTFSLHEQVKGSDYKPAHWIVVLAQIHKDQTATVTKKPAAAPEKPKSDAAKGEAKADDKGTETKPVQGAAPQGPTKREQHLPLKIFFLLVALGLCTSTLTGIYMAYKYERSKAVVTGLLVAGLVVPLVLLAF